MTPPSEPGLWQAFAQQFINLWVLPGSSESVTKLCPPPPQDTRMSLHTSDLSWTLLGFTNSLRLIRTLPFSTGA